MKILYVGDGSKCRVNWGAQATSEALRDILASQNAISGVIPSTYKLPPSVPVLYSSILPLDLLDKSNISSFWKFVWDMYGKLKLKDYIAEDADTSIKNFLKLKAKYPRLEAIYQKLTECEAVVLNGEGTMILSKVPKRWALFFLFIIKIAKQLGKKAYYVNGMISDSPVSSRNTKTAADMVKVFELCDGISVRDKTSYTLLKEMGPQLNCTYIPDALFSWSHFFENRAFLPTSNTIKTTTGTFTGNFDFSKPYICISGSSAAAKVHDKTDIIKGYIDLVNKLKETNVQLYLVPTCSGDFFLHKVGEKTNVSVIPVEVDIKTGGAILANAALFVSGRFHPAILASDGGTPCIFMKSNSHKTLSLQEVLEYPAPHKEYDAKPNPSDIEAIYNDTVAILAEGEARRNAIKTTVKKLSADTGRLLELIK